MTNQQETSDQQWFPTQVDLDNLGPYRAEVTVHRWNGFMCPRFDRQEVERLAADTERLAEGRSGVDVVRINGDNVEIWSTAFSRTGSDYELVESYPESDGRWEVGSYQWAWQECTDRDTTWYREWTGQTLSYDYAKADTWTVAFADHGYYMAVLGTFRTPLNDSELSVSLWASHLSSYILTAPNNREAERRARAHFAQDRADVHPGDRVMPLALPNTRIPAPGA
ncbi:hypothetical protein [Streptomyces xiamenensis]|uniref:hypothetical protein n=1 Tax=Streptomyces xiamenensis TaxID=408015 RepID=UPI0035D74E31